MTTMDRKHLTEPSPSDWERWVERLAAGEEPLTAARAEGQTCTRFRRQNPQAHAEALALSREARAHEVDRRGEEWALASDASDAMKLAWAKRWNPAWAGTMHVDVEHGGTITVEHERRLTLADVAAFAATLHLDGHRGGTGGELSPARALLAESPES